MPPEMRTVKLRRPHKHGGTPLEVGATLVLTRQRAEWLVAEGGADPVGWEFTGQRREVPARATAADTPKVSARRSGCCGSRWP